MELAAEKCRLAKGAEEHAVALDAKIAAATVELSAGREDETCPSDIVIGGTRRRLSKPRCPRRPRIPPRRRTRTTCLHKRRLT